MRPVLMTAAAMIIGMFPCRWGSARVASRTLPGTGGDRRTAGGHVTTLLFVPVVYSLLRCGQIVGKAAAD